MLSITDLEAIRAIVREELDRHRPPKPKKAKRREPLRAVAEERESPTPRGSGTRKR